MEEWRLRGEKEMKELMKLLQLLLNPPKKEIDLSRFSRFDDELNKEELGNYLFTIKSGNITWNIFDSKK